MKSINFKDDAAGIKTLWIIRFNEVYPHLYGEEKAKPHFELLFPSPVNKDRWLVVDLEKGTKDLKTVERYQKLFEEARDHYSNQLIKIENLGNQGQETGQEIDNLAQLLVYFNEILRNIRKKGDVPPESEER